ncbi:MAG: hypothetical protein KAI80_13700 [Hyphomicrobiaceae bacterium]|nr:hypothetical protein [Hyphomicrobiaceae bacterium]
MRKSVFRSGAVVAAAIFLPLVMGPTQAEAFNFPMKLSNGKTCRVLMGQTHWHVGDSDDANKAAAQSKAKRNWSRFVVFEYGRRYGNWNAADKSAMKCSRDTIAGVWRCRAEGQPCKG